MFNSCWLSSFCWDTIRIGEKKYINTLPTHTRTPNISVILSQISW